jgi:hypothetical protein
MQDNSNDVCNVISSTNQFSNEFKMLLTPQTQTQTGGGYVQDLNISTLPKIKFKLDKKYIDKVVKLANLIHSPNQEDNTLMTPQESEALHNMQCFIGQPGVSDNKKNTIYQEFVEAIDEYLRVTPNMTQEEITFIEEYKHDITSEFKPHEYIGQMLSMFIKTLYFIMFMMKRLSESPAGALIAKILYYLFVILKFTFQFLINTSLGVAIIFIFILYTYQTSITYGILDLISKTSLVYLTNNKDAVIAVVSKLGEGVYQAHQGTVNAYVEEIVKGAATEVAKGIAAEAAQQSAINAATSQLTSSAVSAMAKAVFPALIDIVAPAITGVNTNFAQITSSGGRRTRRRAKHSASKKQLKHKKHKKQTKKNKRHKKNK